MRIADIREQLARSFSVQQLTKNIMAGITKSESGPDRLNAFISWDRESALRAAERIDVDRAAGGTLPLAGVPVAIKDNLCTAGQATTCASRMLANFIAPYDATVVRRLRNAGAIVAGKTNLDEFAMGSTTESSAWGRTQNPRAAGRVTGGSSGGSAAAVAAGLVPVALGTDTAGSVRQPASFCGVVGFKPSYGRVSRYGLIAYASSLDTVGIFTVTARDAAEVFGVIAGRDPLDATTEDHVSEPERLASLAGKVIGIPREYYPPELHPDVRQACDRVVDLLRQAGAHVHDIGLPHTDFAIPAYYALSTVEAATNLARYDGVRYGTRVDGGLELQDLYQRTRTNGFGNEVKRRIMLGMHMLSEPMRATLVRAGVARAAIRRDFERVFADGIDFIFTPTTATPAFVAGDKTDPYELYVSDMLTVAANLAGLPAISLPVGRAGGLPIGAQLMAPRWHDEVLLDAATLVEELLA